jgi:hypothetical protein
MDQVKKIFDLLLQVLTKEKQDHDISEDSYRVISYKIFGRMNAKIIKNEAGQKLTGT